MEIVILILFGAIGLFHGTKIWLKAIRINAYHFEPCKNNPRISVIVSAHNEILNLKELIPILLNQTYSSYEIIIVLDRCTDRSDQLVQKFQTQQLSILEINEQHPNFHPKKYGITKAIDQASGEWILLTDADCRPSTKWISEMATAMHASNEVVIGLSPYFKSKGLLNFLIQYETFQTAFHLTASATNGKPYMALGRNLAYKRSLFLRKKGFGELSHVTGGDDDLLVQKLLTGNNFQIVLSKESLVDSVPETNWRNYIIQKTRHFSVGKHYLPWIKKTESTRWFIHLFFWILSILSIVINPVLGTAILAAVLLIKGISFNIVDKRLGKRFNPIWLPFVDLLYVVIFPLISLRSMMVKNNTWK